jgi:hypothetical protein
MACMRSEVDGEWDGRMGKKGIWGVREVGVRRLYVMGSVTLREAAKVYRYFWRQTMGLTLLSQFSTSPQIKPVYYHSFPRSSTTTPWWVLRGGGWAV